MDDNQFSELLTRHKADIEAAALEAVMKNVTRTFEWEMPETVKTIVSDFMRDEVAPAVAARLKDEKGAIIAAVSDAAVSIGEKLKDQMVENAKNSLSGYAGRDIISKLVSGS